MKSSGDGVGDGEREEIQSPRLESTDLIGPSGHKITRDDVMAAMAHVLAQHPGARIDMSQLHPIGDHRPFSRHCRGWAGGGWRHVKLVYQHGVLPRFRANTMCRIGRHRMIWHRVPQFKIRYPICNDCGIRLLTHK